MEYESNSHKSKDEKNKTFLPENEKNIKKIVSGTAKVKKKNGFQKILRDIFVSRDATDIKEHIWFDVIVPALKKSIVDFVDAIVYPNNKRTSKVSYQPYYDSKSNNRSRRNDDRAGRNSFYEEIIVDSRGEAEEIIDKMNEIIVNYDVVSVADLYEMIGYDKKSRYTDFNYGWSDLRGAKAVRVPDGFLLGLPSPIRL